MYSLLKGRRAGLIFGFFAGLLIDLFNGYENVIGINALIYMYIGFVNGIFKDIINYLKPGDCLVRNNTKVIPARLYGTGEQPGNFRRGI